MRYLIVVAFCKLKLNPRPLIAILSGLNFLEERDNAKGLRAGLLVSWRRRQQ
jgi:hypothetical protein